MNDVIKESERRKQIKQAINIAVGADDQDSMVLLCDEEFAVKHLIHCLHKCIKARIYDIIDKHLEEFKFLFNEQEIVRFNNIKNTHDKIDLIREQIVKLSK